MNMQLIIWILITQAPDFGPSVPPINVIYLSVKMQQSALGTAEAYTTARIAHS